jgi:hypothetical protein
MAHPPPAAAPVKCATKNPYRYWQCMCCGSVTRSLAVGELGKPALRLWTFLHAVGPRELAQLVEEFGEPKPSIQKHLNTLRELGLIEDVDGHSIGRHPDLDQVAKAAGIRPHLAQDRARHRTQRRGFKEFQDTRRAAFLSSVAAQRASEARLIASAAGSSRRAAALSASPPGPSREAQIDHEAAS